MRFKGIKKRGSAFFSLSKRQKFVLLVLLLSSGLFATQFVSGTNLLIAGFLQALVTDIMLYLIIRKDVKGKFFYPIFILPFFFSLSFVIFYSVVPQRLLARLLITFFYGFGMYSLLLTLNILAVSTIRTISLLRSARIVSIILTNLIVFFMINIIFSLRIEYFLTPLFVFGLTFLMGVQSLWVRTIEDVKVKDVLVHSLFISFGLTQLALVLSLWAVSAAIYSLFLTGIFYMYIGLTHIWFEKRLFKGILWEYVWVGFVSVLFLLFFSEWGI